MADACEYPETEVRLEWAERWLSPSRLSSYLNLCGGDVERALELHEWNLMLGRALMGDIAHFELALRNAYDRALTERFEGDEHWLFDASSPVTRPIMRKSKAKKLRDVNMVNRRAIDDARGRAHDPANPNQVIAGLMLGFWAHMTDRSRERDLWIPYLHAAWPAGTDRAKLTCSSKRSTSYATALHTASACSIQGPMGVRPQGSTRRCLLCSVLYRQKLMKSFTATRARRRSRDSSMTTHRR